LQNVFRNGHNEFPALPRAGIAYIFFNYKGLDMINSVSEFIRRHQEAAPEITGKPKDLKNLLLVGNTFLVFNCSVHRFLSAFARERNIPAVITMIGLKESCLHWDAVNTYLCPAAPEDKPQEEGAAEKPGTRIFDAVVFEDSSDGPFLPESKEDAEAAAKGHVEAARAHGAVPFIMMTWADKDTPWMIAQVAVETVGVANRIGCRVIPSGLAFALAAKRCPEIELIGDDNRRPTVAGTYLTAAVFFAALTGVSPVGCKAHGGFGEPHVTQEEALALQQIAWETVSEFNGWTE
jgi:hypothetical protein